MRILSLCLALSLSASAADRFSERLTEDERRAAGLHQLTPGQLAVLDKFVQREREGGERAVREKATAEAKAQVREEEKQRRVAETRVLSRLVGSFDGWSRGTEFRLENGQVWRHTGSDVRAVARVEAPAILIEKVFGGWRLYDASGGWCPVVRVK
jgi:hypothetical protein